MSDNQHWYHVFSPEGFVALEHGTSETEAARIAAASRPGYEGCRAELYIPEYEREAEDERWAKARDEIERIEKCLIDVF